MKVDLLGQKFGFLTVIRKLEERTKGRKVQWECQCDCGNNTKVITTTDHLRSGHTKSCGCYHVQRTIETKRKDLANQKFGKLLVLNYNYTKDNRAYWNCLCDCGKNTIVEANNLTSGHTKSCGCLRTEIGRSKRENLIGQKFSHLTPIKTCYKNKKIRWICRCDCGAISLVMPGHLKNGHTQSCGCISSRGEEKIAELLNINKIQFQKEYSFQDLISEKGKCLRFDFAIFQNEKIKYLIEYNGLQHYRNGGTWHTPALVKNDSLKQQYCCTRSIPLIIIPYNKLNTLTINDLILSEVL